MRHLRNFVIGLTLVVSACGGSEGPGQPTIAAGSPPAGATGIAYPGYTFTVARGGAPPFTWSETGALPPGMALSSAGQLTGTPVSAGTYAFTVRVADSSTPAVTGTLPVSLKIDAVMISPGQMPPAGVHGRPYDFTFTATGGNLPLSWTVTAGTLPPGLTLNSGGTLSGKPTAARSTPFAFTVTVTDSSTPKPAANSVAYAITISEPPPPTINNTPPPTATVGSPYSFPFTASEGLAPLLWIPPNAPMGGLTVSSEGILSGTPSTAGIFPITLTVKDALNQSSPATPFTVRVAMARPAAAFVPTGDMTAPRSQHTATLLLDGRVLIAGGLQGWGPGYYPAFYGDVPKVASAELYDPVSGTFTSTGSMSEARSGHTATLLIDGTVLVTGTDNTAELFSPATGTFSVVGEPYGGFRATATLRNDGTVLVAGGRYVAPHTDVSGAAAQFFAPESGGFVATGSLITARDGHTATLLVDGTVLVTGGTHSTRRCHPGGPCSGSIAVLSSAELFK